MTFAASNQTRTKMLTPVLLKNTMNSGIQPVFTNATDDNSM